MNKNKSNKIITWRAYILASDVNCKDNIHAEGLHSSLLREQLWGADLKFCT